MTTDVLILPGYLNSDPDHWQSLWEQSYPSCSRVMQRDWERPDCDEWVAELEKRVAAAGPETVLVAHSMGCLLVAHWSSRTRLKIKGALLVAPPDPGGAQFPASAMGFGSLPAEAFGFPSIMVASSNDPYGELSFAQHCARDWGCQFINLGEAGHINTETGLGDWPYGISLLQQLMG
ncbi:RBBP9/YdeN family alpha/beta hydrolase [Nitrincola alkalilacustris]|uniref:RBBP9/YdeN family alpha/beta hydrolase n=1 Tax=Nitrincola alkalilacustris TaxID=1571224 RepID=UPI00124D7783|nr:alpha/beta hydrolase [Nitrincola alkalilacustris]